MMTQLMNITTYNSQSGLSMVVCQGLSIYIFSPPTPQGCCYRKNEARMLSTFSVKYIFYKKNQNKNNIKNNSFECLLIVKQNINILHIRRVAGTVKQFILLLLFLMFLLDIILIYCHVKAAISYKAILSFYS